MNYLDLEPTIITIETPGHLNFPGVVGSTADAICIFMGFDELEIIRVNHAVVEAVTNASKHGSRNDPRKRVVTTFSIWRDRLEVEVKDQGQGFDLAAARAKALIAGTGDAYLGEDGRGLFIMTESMHSVDFRFSPDGTRCLLMKRLQVPMVMRA